MSSTDVDRRWGQAPSQALAFAAADGEEVARIVGGMLNSGGGTILIRTEEVADRADELAAHLLQRISPPASWAFSAKTQDGVERLVVDVPDGPQKPYVVDGRIYVREGSVERPAVAADLSRLIEERTAQDLLWERRPALGVTVEDLDAEEIARTRRIAVESGRFDPSTTGTDETLRKLNLTEEGTPLQAAVVAFADEVMPWYPQCCLRLARFEGTTKEGFRDGRRVFGHAFRLLAEAQAFLERHLSIAGTVAAGSLRRQDRPEYPVLALREALVNAFCHRDYSVPGGTVSIAIFDDRLEIANSGRLPEGWTVADLLREHASCPPNPLLADLFYRRGLSELWGRGTLGIVRQCLEAGCPEPQFEERSGEVIVRFRPAAPPASADSNLDDLSERQTRVLERIRTSARATLREIKDSVAPDMPDSTLRSELIRLRSLGLIESVGFGRGAFWRPARIAPTT